MAEACFLTEEKDKELEELALKVFENDGDTILSQRLRTALYLMGGSLETIEEENSRERIEFLKFMFSTRKPMKLKPDFVREKIFNLELAGRLFDLDSLINSFCRSVLKNNERCDVLNKKMKDRYIYAISNGYYTSKYPPGEDFKRICLHYMSFTDDPDLALVCFSSLLDWMHRGWVPNYKSIAEIFINFGVDPTYLLPDSSLNAFQFKKRTYSCDDMMSFGHSIGLVIKLLVQLPNFSKWSCSEIKYTMRILILLQGDETILGLHFDDIPIVKAFSHLLNSFTDEEFKKEVASIADYLYMKFLPDSFNSHTVWFVRAFNERGQQLAYHISLKLICGIYKLQVPEIERVSMSDIGVILKRKAEEEIGILSAYIVTNIILSLIHTSFPLSEETVENLKDWVNERMEESFDAENSIDCHQLWSSVQELRDTLQHALGQIQNKLVN